MLIVALECSTKLASIAIFQGETHVASCDFITSFGARLNPSLLASGLLSKHGLSFNNVELYAVSIGPGSYSGLRTAIATIQGFAIPSNTPILPICTADVMAYQIQQKFFYEQGRLITILGDARRKQIWYRTYRIEQDAILPINDFALINYSDVYQIPASYLAGPDMDKLAPILKEGISNNHYLQETPEYPLATTLGLLANKYISQKTLDNQIKPIPIYMHSAV